MLIRLVLVLSIAIAYLSSAEKALVLGYVEFPPYTYTDKDGKAAGLYIDKAKTLFTELGLAFEAQALPPKRLYQHLADGKIDFFLGINTSETIKGKIVSSTLPIGAIELKAFHLPKEDKNINSIDDLRSMSIGIIRGYSYGSVLNKLKEDRHKNTMQHVTDHKSGFGMLKLGRIDIFLGYAGPSNAYLKQEKDLKLSSLSLFKLDCYIVMNKNVKNAQLTIDKLDKLMKEESTTEK